MKPKEVVNKRDGGKPHADLEKASGDAPDFWVDLRVEKRRHFSSYEARPEEQEIYDHAGKFSLKNTCNFRRISGVGALHAVVSIFQRSLKVTAASIFRYDQDGT